MNEGHRNGGANPTGFSLPGVVNFRDAYLCFLIQDELVFEGRLATGAET